MTEPPCPIVHLRDLGSERYILRFPLPVLVLSGGPGSESSAYWEEGAAWGQGRTAGEAMAKLGQDIVRLYEEVRDGVPETLKILSKAERRALMESIQDPETKMREDGVIRDGAAAMALEKKRARQRKWNADQKARLAAAKQPEPPQVLQVDGKNYSIVMVPKLLPASDLGTQALQTAPATEEYQQELWREILATQSIAPPDLPTFISKVIADNPGVFK